MNRFATTTKLQYFAYISFLGSWFINELWLEKVSPKVHPIVDPLVRLHDKQRRQWARDIQETTSFYVSVGLD